MFDGLRIVLYIGIAAMVVAMVCLTWIGIANSGSRNISLALGAMFGTLLLLGVQMFFELRSNKTAAVIKTEFTTDRAKSKIRQFRYPTASMNRFSNEVDANKFLLATNPKAFEGDGETLWKDMSLFSLVLYLWYEHDWQIARDSLDGSEFGTFETFKFLSPPEDSSQCTKVSLSELQAKLRDIHNLFADFKPLVFEFMCLPPNAALRIEPGLVVIETPFCEVRFVIEQQWLAKQNWRPGKSSDQPLLPNDGGPRFQTRTGVVRATTTYAWIRAQSREMPTYQAWANDVVERARRWFSTEIKGDTFLGGQFE